MKRNIGSLVLLLMCSLLSAMVWAVHPAGAEDIVEPPALSIGLWRESLDMPYDPSIIRIGQSMTEMYALPSDALAPPAVWKCEQIEGRALNVYCNVRYGTNGNVADLWLHDRPGPGTYRFKVTATRASSSASALFTLNMKVAPPNMPTGLSYDIGETVVVKPGDVFTLPAPRFKPANAVMPDNGVFQTSVTVSALSPQLSYTVDRATGLHTYRTEGPGIYEIYVGALVDGVHGVSGQYFTLAVTDDPSDLSALLHPLRMSPVDIIMHPESKPSSGMQGMTRIGGDLFPRDAVFDFTIEHMDGADCVDLGVRNSFNSGAVLFLKQLKTASPGRYRLTATCEKYNLSCSTAVVVWFSTGEDGETVEIPAFGLVLSKSAVTINERQSVKLSVRKFKPANVSRKLKRVIWESEIPEIATVDASGRVTGVAPGKVTIRAYAVDAQGEKNPAVYATSMITVRPPKIARLDFVEKSLTLTAGDSRDLGSLLSVEPINGSGRVVWKSAQRRIARVKDGMLTALKPGKTKITAYVKGRAKVKSVLTLTVVAPTAQPSGNTLGDAPID